MRSSNKWKFCLCAVALSVNIAAVSPIVGGVAGVVYAQSVDNDFSGSTSGGNSVGDAASNFLDKGSITQDDQDVADFIGSQRGVTGENLQSAAEAISPLTNGLGWLAGAIIAFISLAIFTVTAIDLAYIAIPPIRTFLYTPGTDGTGAMTAGRGYGAYGAYGGMAGGMAGGNQQQKRKIQWVSDECVQVCALMGGSSMTEGMGGMSRGYGGYAAQPQVQATRGSVIKEYLKKRAFFIVLFAICIVVLMSSVFMGFGVNLAQWGIKILDAINNLLGGSL